MLILLTAVNEEIGACFVGAFDDNKVSEILGLPKNVKPIGIICIGYPDEKPEKLERIDINALVHYEKYVAVAADNSSFLLKKVQPAAANELSE